MEIVMLSLDRNKHRPCEIKGVFLYGAIGRDQGISTLATRRAASRI